MTYTQALFQVRYMPRHSGLGYVQSISCLHKAAGIDHRREGSHFSKFIHLSHLTRLFISLLGSHVVRLLADGPFESKLSPKRVITTPKVFDESVRIC